MSQSKPPCQFFTFGCCKFDDGDACSFSHDRSVCIPGSIKKPCIHHQKNNCRYGKFCLYLHDDVTTSAVVPPTAPPVKIEKRTSSHKKPVPYNPPLIVPIEKVKPIDLRSTVPETQEEYVAQLKQGNTYYYGDPSAFDDQINDPLNFPAPGYHSDAPKHIAGTRVEPSKTFHRNSTTNAGKLPVCRFFLQGKCMKQDSCRFSHDVDTDEMALIHQEEEISKDLECGICMDNILENHKRFGILMACNHVFCLECIRGWRQSEMSDYDATKSNVRHCPTCRAESFIVVPCNRFVTDPERKIQLFQKYVQNLSEIPCRHFSSGNCPFGSSCFYRHVSNDTADYTQTRFVKSADGLTSGPSSSRMGDILAAQLQAQLNTSE